MSKKKHRKSSSSSSSKRSKRSSDSATTKSSSSSSSKKKSEKSKKSSKKSDQIQQAATTAPPSSLSTQDSVTNSDTNSLNLTDKDLLDTQLMKAPEVPSQASDSSSKKSEKTSSSKRKKKSRSKSRTKEEKLVAADEKKIVENLLPQVNKKIVLELEPLIPLPISPSTIPLPSPQPVPPPPSSLETLLKPVDIVNTPPAFASISVKKPIKIELKAESKLPLLLPNVFSSPALLESFSPPTPPHNQSVSTTKTNYSMGSMAKDDSKVRPRKILLIKHKFILVY